jgi:hypothetical protein
VVATVHDLKIEHSLGYDWVYAWCPCGWSTDKMWNPRQHAEDDLKTAFHGHLKSALIDGDVCDGV